MDERPIEFVALDMEGVLTAEPTVWEIMHRKLGTWESHGLPYWNRYRAGEIAYDAFARMDAAVWKGAPESLLLEAAAEVPLTPGCAELLDGLRERGVRTAIVSSGLLCVAKRLAGRFGVVRALANRRRAHNGRLTGELDIRVPYEDKGRILKALMAEMDVAPERAAAVGDSRSDAAMFRVVGLGVAFRPSDPHAAEAADHVVRQGDLRDVARVLRGGGEPRYTPRV